MQALSLKNWNKWRNDYSVPNKLNLVSIYKISIIFKSKGKKAKK